jgi:hypothetical protein
MTEQLFETKVINNRTELYSLYESNGQVIERIAEKGWIIIASQDPKTTYARWDEIQVFKDRIELHQRPGWVEPSRGQFTTELLNTDGQELESRVVNGGVIFLPRHIPVRVDVELFDPLIYSSRLEIKRVWERRPSDVCLGYFCRVPVLKDDKTERPQAEIELALLRMEDQDIEPPPLSTPVAEEEPKVLFETIFENKSDKARLVWADNGAKFFTVGADMKVLLESYDQRAMYSRFKKVTFKKDGRIDLDENHKWKNPYELSIELRNEDGVPQEALTLGGHDVIAIKGIPRFVEVKLEEAAVFYKSFCWKRVKEKRERPSLPGYFDYVEGVRLIKEPRSEKEIRGLRAERARLVDWEAEREKARIMDGKR